MMTDDEAFDLPFRREVKKIKIPQFSDEVTHKSDENFKEGEREREIKA